MPMPALHDPADAGCEMHEIMGLAPRPGAKCPRCEPLRASDREEGEGDK